VKIRAVPAKNIQPSARLERRKKSVMMALLGQMANGNHFPAFASGVSVRKVHYMARIGYGNGIRIQ